MKQKIPPIVLPSLLLLFLIVQPGIAWGQIREETISVDLQAPSHPFPHYWEQMFGSGRAILSLLDSYRRDLREVKDATGFQYIRFHAIFHDFRERDKPIPRDFWHALLFYTTGEIVRRDVEYGSMTLTEEQKTGPSAYLPYAARFGLYSGSWEHFRALLDLYWLPYLDGRLSFDTAIARIAADM